MKDNLSLDLFVVMSKANRAVTVAVEKKIKSLNINPTEFGILEVIYHKGTLPIQQVAEKILISSSRISYAINQLEEKGLIKRIPCQKDKRVIYAALTQAGQDFMDSVFEQHTQDIERIFSVLSDEEKKTLIKLNKKLGLSLT
ncbi:MAG TPA: MarR family transcriptional regulator [Erysipelothrix sp.]